MTVVPAGSVILVRLPLLHELPNSMAALPSMMMLSVCTCCQYHSVPYMMLKPARVNLSGADVTS